MDCCREGLETTTAGQQDLSNLRHNLTQFHRLTKLKLERAFEGFINLRRFSMAKVLLFDSAIQEVLFKMDADPSYRSMSKQNTEGFLSELPVLKFSIDENLGFED